MIGFRKFLLALLALLAISLGGTAAPPPAVPTKEIEERILPAYFDNDALTLFKNASQLFSNLRDEQTEKTNAYLTRRGIPDLGTVVARARLELVKANFVAKLEKPTAREIPFLIAETQDQISSGIKEVGESTLFDESKKAMSFRELETVLWKSRAATNQLGSLMRLVGYQNQLLQRKRRQNESVDNEARVRANQILSELRETATRLADNVVELRMQRIQLSRETLESSSEFRERLLSAWYGELDSNALLDLVKQTDSGHAVPDRLLEAGMETTIVARRNAIRELAGIDLMKKSKLLFEGLHWWLRGRYGMGTRARGFLKHPTSLKSPQRMFALYMPVEPPTPTPPLDTYGGVPEIDRRHHYIWRFEHRRLVTKISLVRKSEKRIKPTGSPLARFY